jgi:hypothetical protein
MIILIIWLKQIISLLLSFYVVIAPEKAVIHEDAAEKTIALEDSQFLNKS